MPHLSARQRGALWLLLAFLAGQVLDRFALPFEAFSPEVVPPADSLAVPADSIHAAPASTPRPVFPAPTPDDRALSQAGPSTRIAINRATAVELQALPRVGPVLAARIIAHREQNGPFRSLQDLQQVPGIGPRTAAQLAPLLRFD